ncbi:MAG: hypothetical protein M3Q40_10530 [Pseudomonadota bacterium]|nr:hypothetical protein [Pseudomonadota bacterium]
MKRLLMASILVAFAFAASAHPPSDPQAQQQERATAQAESSTETRGDASAAASANAEMDAESKAKLDAQRNCLRYTGSRIPRAGLKDKDCVIANGRVYSREDIERTGQTDIADALRMLDPSIY